MRTERTYGNWSEPTQAGLWRFGYTGTLIFFGGCVTIIFLTAINIVYAIIGASLLILALIPIIYRDRWGRSGWELTSIKLSWWFHVKRKHNTYERTELNKDAPGNNLPGVGANIFLIPSTTPSNESFVFLHHKGVRQVSVVLECAPTGATLVDADEIDTQVAAWGDFLAGMGHEQTIAGLSVTVESKPDTGHSLKKSIDNNIKNNIPDIAKQALDEIAETFPTSSSSIRCFLTITWQIKKDSSLEYLLPEISDKLPEIKISLSATGAGASRLLNEKQISELVRSDFDLNFAKNIDNQTSDTTWNYLGVDKTYEEKNFYQHNNCHSVSWFMGTAPQGSVYSNVLKRILEPNTELGCKRVTILYRPFNIVEAARKVDTEILNTRLALGQQKNQKAKATLKLASAQQTADEEALGAGLLRFGLVVTSTNLGEPTNEKLNRMSSIVEHSANASRLKLRKADYFQAPTFMLGLPLGIVSHGYPATIGR